MTTDVTTNLLEDARDVLPEIVDIRRRLHAEPELGLQLPKTQAVVAADLESLGIEGHRGRSTTSVTAFIDGARPGPTILVRADMDALPLTEETGLDFASTVEGRMHACGHDTHVAMLLGAARLLIDRRRDFAGRVLLMFQPGEEGFHGARYMLDEGLLDEQGVTGAFALHVTTHYASGTVNLKPGPEMAAGDTIRITVRGRGGHASAPHAAADPITVAAEIVLALQVMITRRVDVFDPAVITIANIAAGTTTNIIPETAFIQGTMRTVSEQTRVATREHVRRVAAGIAAAHDVTADVEIEPGYPVTVNDPAFAEFVEGVAAELVGAEQVARMPAPIMGAEDFSYVLQRVPGAMVFLGARPADLDPATAPQNHSNRVVFDEDAMAVGSALYAAVALRHLGR
ncbi:MAG TPA: M20 family metallopeptidase [Candidatus Limnocylindrales bacterium]|nr:M20 family metallopeptidase [Candidatus Limnocylindrales bacterium]